MSESRVEVDEITGLPVPPKRGEREFIVVQGGYALSIHTSMAAAKAWIHWNLDAARCADSSIIVVNV